MTIIDETRALELLEQAVGDETSKVYEAPFKNQYNDDVCVYVHDGKPSCVVGCALALAGVPVEKLQKLDGRFKPTDSGMAAYNLFNSDVIHEHTGDLGFDLGVEITREGALVLSAAQDEQDRREPWGHALSSARAQWKRIQTQKGVKLGDDA